MKCCKIGCKEMAEFEIFDKNDPRPDAYTHSCHAHVGELIGSLPPTNLTGPWEVFLITSMYKKALTLQLPVTGIATLDLNAAEIENIPTQKAYYSLEIPSGQFDFPVYIDQNAGARGDLNIVNSILPSFVPSEIVTIPTGQDFPNLHANTSGSNFTYYTSVVSTQDNPILTIQAQYNEYEGNVVIQGSTIPDGEWYTIIESDNYSNITDTKGYTIYGYHPFVRMQFNSEQGEVGNILAR
jgi:hypothetical protein